MRLILSIPLFFYILIAANIIMLSGPIDQSMINVILFEFDLPSQRRIITTVSDAFILASIFFLYIETFKATRTSVISIIDHALSLLVFVIFLIELLVVPRLGNMTFDHDNGVFNGCSNGLHSDDINSETRYCVWRLMLGQSEMFTT